MEEIHKKHELELLLTQLSQMDVTSDALTQGTFASRTSIFTSSTSLDSSGMVHISSEDMDAFQRALGKKEQILRDKWEGAKRKHRREEDDMQNEIAELQAKKSALENGDFVFIA